MKAKAIIFHEIKIIKTKAEAVLTVRKRHLYAVYCLKSIFVGH